MLGSAADSTSTSELDSAPLSKRKLQYESMDGFNQHMYGEVLARLSLQSVIARTSEEMTVSINEPRVNLLQYRKVLASLQSLASRSQSDLTISITSAFGGGPMAEVRIHRDAHVKELKQHITRVTGVSYMQLVVGDRVLGNDELVGKALGAKDDDVTGAVSLVAMHGPKWQVHEGLDTKGGDVLKLETCRGHGFMLDPDFIETMQQLCVRKGWMCFNVHSNGRLFNAKIPSSTKNVRDNMRCAKDWRLYVPAEDLVLPPQKSLSTESTAQWKAYDGWDMKGGDVIGLTVWYKHGPFKDPEFVESMKLLCQKKGWKAFNLNDAGTYFHAKTGPSAQAVLDVAKPTRDWTLYVLVEEDAVPRLRPWRLGAQLKWTAHEDWDMPGTDVLEFETCKGHGLFRKPAFVESMQYLCEQKSWKAFSVSGKGRWFSAKTAASCDEVRGKMVKAPNCTLYMPFEDEDAKEGPYKHRDRSSSQQGWTVHKDFYMPGGNVLKFSASFGHGLFNDPAFIESMKYLCEQEGWIGFNVNDRGWWFNVKTAPSIRSVMDYSKPMGGWTLFVREDTKQS